MFALVDHLLHVEVAVQPHCHRLDLAARLLGVRGEGPEALSDLGAYCC